LFPLSPPAFPTTCSLFVQNLHLLPSFVPPETLLTRPFGCSLAARLCTFNFRMPRLTRSLLIGRLSAFRAVHFLSVVPLSAPCLSFRYLTILVYPPPPFLQRHNQTMSSIHDYGTTLWFFIRSPRGVSLSFEFSSHLLSFRLTCRPRSPLLPQSFFFGLPSSSGEDVF